MKKIITKERVTTELIDFLCQQFYVEKEDIHLDESLVDTGIIDSIGLIEITAYIQKNYNIKVENEHMNKSNFGSVNKITNYILNEIPLQ